MKRTLARLLVGGAALAAPCLVVISPASAVQGTTYWSVSAPSGWANGSVYASGSANRWSLSGTLRDNKAGDDCTKVEVSTLMTDNTYDRDVATKRLCGGLSGAFSASGPIYISLSPDVKEVLIRVCQDRTLKTDVCSETGVRVQ